MTLPIKQADAEVLLEYAGKVLGIMGGPGALNDWLERIPPGAESDSDEKVIEDCTAFLVREAGGGRRLSPRGGQHHRSRARAARGHRGQQVMSNTKRRRQYIDALADAVQAFDALQPKG